MKIPAINQSYGLYNKQSQNQKAKKSTPIYSPSFMMAVDTSKFKKLPLDEKLGRVFSCMASDDLLAIGANMQEIAQGIKKTISHYDKAIKRILHIKDGGLSVPLAFTCNEEGDIRCINIGQKDVTIICDEQSDTIEPGDNFLVLEGDVILNNKRLINIKNETPLLDAISSEENDAEEFEAIFDPENYATKVYTFKDHQAQVEKSNLELLTTITEKKSEQKIKKNGTTFADVGGLDEVVKNLERSVVFPVKYPFAFENIETNKGILLYGKPGTGKTLLAEALANEIDGKFIKLNGLEMESKWVGETEQNWRKLFDEAKAEQPAVIFIDEFDGVAKERGGQDVHGDKVVNQLLTLMTDIKNEQIFVIAATNRPDALDKAVLRSGRFGKHIEVPAPNKEGLREIFRIHTSKKNLDTNLDTESLLDKLTEKQFTGADMKHLVEEAHVKSWERAGIFEKMKNGTIEKADIDSVYIIQEDFDKVLKEMQVSMNKKDIKPIGYNR